MSLLNEQKLIIKKWILEGKHVEVTVVNAKLAFVVRKDDTVAYIPSYNIVGLPKELNVNKPNELAMFFSDSYIKLNHLDDGSYKLYVNQRVKGGANIINPAQEPAKLWPKGIVPYEIDSTKYPVGEKEREIVKAAIAEWNNAGTGFRLIPRTTEHDYVIFGEAENVCNSYVGRFGGAQYVRCDLDGGGFDKGSILHEIGHAIGFYHEHQRPDRYQHVVVNSRDTVNYGIQGNTHGNYDFNSIMHYYFDGILKPRYPLTNAELVGRMGRLSDGDKEAAKYLYRESLSRNVPPNVNLNFTQPAPNIQFFRKPQYEVLREKGDFYLKRKDYVKAFKHYNAILVEYGQALSDAYKSELCDSCGICAYHLREKDNAVDWFTDAVKLNINNQNAKRNLKITQKEIQEEYNASACLTL